MNYKIISEERFYTDGRLVNVTVPSQFFYVVDLVTGVLNMKPVDISNQKLTSILVTVNVQDISLSSLLSVNCQVAFRFTVLQNPLVFIGSDYRSVDLCEDVPVSSPILTLTVFDSSFSTNQICFSILNNRNFDLINGNNTSNGTVILTALIDFENAPSVINFTAQAYFCNTPGIYIQQTVAVKILNVNEYAPLLEPQQTPIEISLNTSSTYLSKTLFVLDNDTYPFNKYECKVLNDNSFLIINSQNSGVSVF